VSSARTPVRAPVRSRRSVLKVAVTGAASPLGEAITRALVAADGIGSVIAVDERRGTTQGVTWRVGDVTSPGVAEQLRGVDAVVFLAAPTDLEAALHDPQRRERAVRAVQAVATASAAVGARRLLAVTSAMVLGATADNLVPLPDDAPVAAAPDSGVVGDLLEVERILARTPRVHPGLAVTVLRPAALVGPDIDTVVTRHFEAPRLLKVKESENAWQFCHFDDVASAVVTALSQELEGALTVGSEGILDQDRLERLTGMRRIELPAALALGTAQRLHRVGLLPTPASDLAFVTYPWAVSSERLRAAGWTAAYDNETCLGVLLEQVRGRHAVAARRMDRKDAALGAAGAAVALVGTAALMRRRRKRGSGG
jgi:nucleoside-diphosphate-sugar epimerase